MNTIDKLIMVYVAVSDMGKAKEFYAGMLGFKVTTDYRQDDNNWWVSLELPGGGASITISTYHGNMKPGSSSMYLSSSDVKAAHEQLTAKGVRSISEIGDDLYGPGSGVKWFSLDDPDGNHWTIAQG